MQKEHKRLRREEVNRLNDEVDLLEIPFEFLLYKIGKKDMVFVPKLEKKGVFH